MGQDFADILGHELRKPPVRIIKSLSSLIIIGAITLFLLEWLGPHLLPAFTRELYLVKDVDHRMLPDPKAGNNSDGIRSSLEADDFQDEDLNIIFLGDSFVYGWRSPAGHTLPDQLQAIANEQQPGNHVRVANFGWVSSSPLLSYRLLENIGAKYKPDVVILGIDMTDIQDDIKYQRLLDKQGVYRLLDIAPLSVVLLENVLEKTGLHGLHRQVFGFPAERFFATRHPLAETRADFSFIQGNIDRIARYSQDQLGAKFVLLVFPRSFQYSDKESPNNWEKAEYVPLGPYVHEPFVYFSELAARAPYPVFSLLPDFHSSGEFPTTFDDDPHWNATGTRIAAEASYRYCQQAGCFD